MFSIQSGVLERTRLVSNVLMVILVAGNIFFSIQYTENIKQNDLNQLNSSENATLRLQTARLLKEFVDVVLNTQGSISYDDRIKLEDDVHQLHDSSLTSLWDQFVASKDSKTAQTNAVKLLSILTNKLI